MSSRPFVKLPRGPTSLDCIAWSDDCEIAVACDETLEILLPKLNIEIPLHAVLETEGSKWQTVRVPVNLFTPQELSFVPPAPSSIFSIGEEQSSSSIAALAWSPPGLAQYKKCALAVLTTNLVLSIWAHDGNPLISGRWKRVLIVNHALPFASRPSNSNSNANGISNNNAERTRFRVRSFCWSPSPHTNSNHAESDPLKTPIGDTYFLAVSNDANEIIICQIQSPFMTPLEPQSGWTARAVLKFDLLPSPQTHSMIFGPKRFADHISWSPWVKDQQSAKSESKSCIGFVSNSSGYLQEINMENKSSSVTVSIERETIHLGNDWGGPMCWTYNPTQKGSLLLASASQCVLIAHVSFFAPDTGLEVSEFGRSKDLFSWKKIISFAFGITNYEVILYAVQEQTNREERPLCFRVPLETPALLAHEGWLAISDDLNEAFADVEKTFPFGSNLKFWGLSSNCINDHLMFCASSHPKNVIYHSRAAERECVVFIKPVDPSTPRRALNSNAEATCFSISRYIGYQAGNGDRDVNRLEVFRRWLEITSTPLTDWAQLLLFEPKISTPEEAILYLQNLFQPSNIAISYISGCLARSDHRPGSTALNEPPSGLISLWALFCAVQKIPKGIFKTNKLMALILWNFLQAQRLLVETGPAYFQEPKRVDIQPSSQEYESLEERCLVCESGILLEDLSWAQCSQGHQFARCGLTLLAIQTPGSSKYCGLCSKRYLSKAFLTSHDLSSDASEVPSGASMDRAVPSGETQHGTTRSEVQNESRREFVEILLAGCETCILCGGKFSVT